MRCDRPPAKAPRDADRHLICEADRLRYPIVDDIPVMLIEEAEKPA